MSGCIFFYTDDILNDNKKYMFWHLRIVHILHLLNMCWKNALLWGVPILQRLTEFYTYSKQASKKADILIKQM